MHAENEPIRTGTLVRELLGLQPASIAAMGPKPPRDGKAPKSKKVREGLHAFARKVLDLYLALERVDGAVVRLKDGPAAAANGWADERTANAGMILVWAMLDGARDVQARSPVPLFAHDPADRRLDPTYDGGREMSAQSMVSRVSLGWHADAEASFRHERGVPPAPEGPAVASVDALIRDLLGLDPDVLVARTLDADNPYFARLSAEARCRRALAVLMRGALWQYTVMHERSVEEARLMTEVDAVDAGRPCAKAANLATLFSVALMTEDGWRIEVRPARDQGPEYHGLLREAASFAVRDGSQRADAALRCMIERDVHFDPVAVARKAALLISEAAKATSEGIAA